MADYDVITVGGGLAGAALAKALAGAGKRVLVVEAETEFRDRVRGELMTAWGVAETKALGIYDVLVGACAHEATHWENFIGPMSVGKRDLAATTPQGCTNLAFYHPSMQETLLAAARASGAEVIRGARVRSVEPGEEPAVEVERDGKAERLTARIVAGCDGRTSNMRKWGGFQQTQDPDRMQLAGLLLDGYAEDDTVRLVFDIGGGVGAFFFPLGDGRVRTYSANRVTSGKRFSGARDVPAYLAELRRAAPQMAPAIKGARAAGPLATFNGADSFVPSPYHSGVALVGDAAATSDPSWGQGLALTMRDVRALSDRLLETDDWDAAGKAYAADHDRYYGALREAEDAFTTFFFGEGPEAGAMRARGFPRMAAAGEAVAPDTMQAGPELAPADETARQRWFGE